MRGKRTLLMAAGASATIVALAIAGCGSGNDNVKASAPAASMQASAPSGATVDVHTGSLGSYLVDAQGRTLYLFEKDKGTTSMCSGACANVWPPSTTSGRPTAGPKVDRALLGTSTRSDGKSQLTYNGHPLYRYSSDAQAGDTNGQDLTEFGGGWYVVSPAGQKIEGHATTSATNGGGNGYY